MNTDTINELPVHRGAKPTGFGLGRCTRHGGFAFRGEGITLEVAACPICGEVLGQTTSALRSGFRMIDGSKAGTDLEREVVRAMMRPRLADVVARRVKAAVELADRHNGDVERIEQREAGVKVWTGSRYATGALEPVRAWTVSTGRYSGFTYGADSKASLETSIERELKVARKFARKAKALGIEVVEVPDALEVKDVPALPDEREALELELEAKRLELTKAEADVAAMNAAGGDRLQYVAMYQRHADEATARIAELEEELEQGAAAGR